MNAIEIWSKISDHQIKGIMFHAQMADLFDFLGLHGFKRQQEYHYFDESAKMRGIHRYVINHHNALIPTSRIEDPKTIPSSWTNYTRFDVDKSTRKSSISEALDKWKQWEMTTKAFYSEMFCEFTKEKCIADADKLNELIKDVDQELKGLCRKIIELKAVDYDPTYIMMCQDEMHNYYQCKTKDIGINIC